MDRVVVHAEEPDRAEEERCHWLFRLEELCDDFEAAWKAGRRILIEEVVQSSPPNLRERLVAELIGLEMELRRQAGETFTEDDYRSRFGVAGEFMDTHVPARVEPSQVG